MAFDIPNFHIDFESPEGKTIQSIMSRDHVDPEEAIRRALRDPAISLVSPGEELIGLFSSEPDREILDDVVREAMIRRKLDTPRDYKL